MSRPFSAMKILFVYTEEYLKSSKERVKEILSKEGA